MGNYNVIAPGLGAGGFFGRATRVLPGVFLKKLLAIPQPWGCCFFKLSGLDRHHHVQKTVVFFRL